MFGQSDHEKWEQDKYWKSPNYETFSNRDRFDYGISFGASFIHKHLVFSIISKQGLKDIDPMGKGKLDTFTFNVGYQL